MRWVLWGLLVLANALFWAWSQGHLQAFGWAPERLREPERLEQQVNPEALRVVPREGTGQE